MRRLIEGAGLRGSLNPLIYRDQRSYLWLVTLVIIHDSPCDKYFDESLEISSMVLINCADSIFNAHKSNLGGRFGYKS